MLVLDNLSMAGALCGKMTSLCSHKTTGMQHLPYRLLEFFFYQLIHSDFHPFHLKTLRVARIKSVCFSWESSSSEDLWVACYRIHGKKEQSAKPKMASNRFNLLSSSFSIVALSHMPHCTHLSMQISHTDKNVFNWWTRGQHLRRTVTCSSIFSFLFYFCLRSFMNA